MRVIGRGNLDGNELVVVQVTPVLDVVHEGRSIPSEYSWAGISFPHIPEVNEPVVASRIFRVKQLELSLSVFMGDSVKAAVDSAGLRGWTFERAWVEA